jgi:hypothetical protein
MKRQRSNPVNGSHAHVVLLSCGGVGNREIAQLVGVVREIIHRFNRGD